MDGTGDVNIPKLLYRQISFLPEWQAVARSTFVDFIAAFGLVGHSHTYLQGPTDRTGLDSNYFLGPRPGLDLARRSLQGCQRFRDQQHRCHQVAGGYTQRNRNRSNGLRESFAGVLLAVTPGGLWVPSSLWKASFHIFRNLDCQPANFQGR